MKKTSKLVEAATQNKYESAQKKSSPPKFEAMSDLKSTKHFNRCSQHLQNHFRDVILPQPPQTQHR